MSTCDTSSIEFVKPYIISFVVLHEVDFMCNNYI